MKLYNSRGHGGAEFDDPKPLPGNKGLSWTGCDLKHKGLYLSEEEVERQELWEHPDLRSYIGGKVVNTHPQQMPHRFVLDVRENYHRYRPGLHQSIQGLNICLVTSGVTKHLIFSFQPTDRVFSQCLYIFPFENYTQFGILQSRVHEVWTRLLSSTLGETLRYTPTDCFDTFPFPKDPKAIVSEIDAAGHELYTARQQWCRENNQGYTTYYNWLKGGASNSEHHELHEALDAAVLDTYGWGDIPIPPFGPEPTQAWKDEVTRRLLRLNRERTDG